MFEKNFNKSLSLIPISLLCFIAILHSRPASIAYAQSATVQTAQTNKAGLSKAQSDKAIQARWQKLVQQTKASALREISQKKISIGAHDLKYLVKTFGDKPEGGHSLYISMHGGGNAAPQVNDQQWQNQIQLYQPKEGIYIAPRAPTDTWNLWHQEHIDALFDRLIQNYVITGQVNPNRVYLMGYSAGGDGVYQLAPRLSDRFAAASMMAGHPNETIPIGLRNIPFSLQVGALDSGFQRNQHAALWEQQLADLKRNDPEGYTHFVKIYEGMGHWMNRQDSVAVEWMAQFTRNSLPNKIVWKQDDYTQNQSYWLSVPQGTAKPYTLVIARLEGQTIYIDTAEDIDQLTILLNDTMLDLDQPVTVRCGSRVLYEKITPRSLKVIQNSINSRRDPNLIFTAQIDLSLNTDTSPRLQPSEPIQKLISVLQKQMPASDKGMIDTDFLQQHATAAWQAKQQAPWGADLPNELFETYVLPYANFNEDRENWRTTLAPIAQEITAGITDIKQAAQKLNRDLYKKVNVQYHPTKRPRPNQCPSESMGAGYASCSGLSILLVDACRSISIPARLAGTPSWVIKRGDANGNHGGNHTWVEIWDGNQWRFVGAAEPGEVDQTWFVANASLADRDQLAHRIYAVTSGRQSIEFFPMVWSIEDQTVPALDVTDYYTQRKTFTVKAADNTSGKIYDNRQLVACFKDGVTSLSLASNRLYNIVVTHSNGQTQRAIFTLPQTDNPVIEIK